MQITPRHWPAYPACERLFALLSQAGGEARFVGGCVRDAVLARPVGDMDIACTHAPEKTLALLEAAGIRTIPTGLAHGTVTALINGTPFEITTLREDIETDGRHAVVRYTRDWQVDASRRDFTMNALSAGLDGQVHDYFNGVEDALTGRLRFIGDATARITEDALRILRFFRFYAHYGQPPYDPQALAACAAQAQRIDALSGERIQAEMFKLLASPHAAPVLECMAENGILPHTGLHSANLPALAKLDTPLLRLAALLHGTDSAALASRWRLSNKDKDLLAQLTRADVQQITACQEATAKQHLRKDGIALFLAQVALAEALTGYDLTRWKTLAETWDIPTFPINGAMLKAKGIAEGRALGETLKILEKKWESADYQPTAEELLASL